jgi:hypothetical protein
MADDADFLLYVLASRKPLLQLVGLWSETYDSLEAYLLWGLVMCDPEVHRMAMREEFQIRDVDPFEDYDATGEPLPPDAPRHISPKCAAVDIDWKKLFAALGADGRAAVRQRIKLLGKRG